MNTLAKEAARLVDSLPPDKAQALLEYARYLAEKASEEEWERKFNDPKYAKKLKAMADEAKREIAEGKSEPFDFNRL